MVQFRKFRQGLGTEKVPMKLEDWLDEEIEPDYKRSKQSPSHQRWRSSPNDFPEPATQYNPLDEPSPLGLRLRKSTSLLELIQMRLSKVNSSNPDPGEEDHDFNLGVHKDRKVSAADKLKAANFCASILRIGSWEYKSRYEGDLVAKCYFAKHKLVWEVLESGLKSKIEIQWSDITTLKANLPDDGPGTLNLVLARPPLFFKETNPQPRKHTLWQATSDFTNSQASMYKEHFIQCPQGVLNKNFEKIIQCDTRLNLISQQPEVGLDTPYFEPRVSSFEGSPISSFHDLLPQSAAQSSSLEHSSLMLDHMSREPSPSSVMDARTIEESTNYEAVDSKGSRDWNQIKVGGLHHSMSMSDLVNHIGHCISEQMGPAGTQQLSQNETDYDAMLDDIAQYLLSDTPSTSAPSDEKGLMSRVNSLCCLLQTDPICIEESRDVQLKHGDVNASPAMARKDSFADLLLHLPRIASLPKFLFNISEEDGDGPLRYSRS